MVNIMAFTKSAESNVVNTDAKFRKADAWLNVNLVSKDGAKSKQLGGIPIYADSDLGKWLLSREAGLEGLNLQVDLHVVAEAKPESFEEMFG